MKSVYVGISNENVSGVDYREKKKKTEKMLII